MPTPPLTPPQSKPPSGQPKTPSDEPKPPLTPRPLQPRTPNYVETVPAPVPAAPPPNPEDDEDYDPHPNIPKHGGPRRKCPACLYFPMMPLAEFKDEDIRETDMNETFVPAGFLGIIAPFLSVILIAGSYFGNLISAKSTDASKRSKVRHARAEILSRCPHSVICPQCCEVLEIY